MRETAKAVEWHRHQVYLNKKYRQEMRYARLLGTLGALAVTIIVLAVDILLVFMKGV